MFAGISRRYDTANHALSGGVDYYWRRRLVRMVEAETPETIADLATGSGDVAIALYRTLPYPVQIVGMDFCEPMLDEARRKVLQLDTGDRDGTLELPKFTFGDCMELPLETNSMDAVTIAFGVRNFEDRHRGLQEIHRVLRVGGHAYILEFSQPYRWFRPFYYLYLKSMLPSLAALVTGDKSAYHYLAGSIESFPTRESLAEEVRQAGFQTVEAIPLTFGIVAIHKATK